ncbi:MAG: phosphopantothenoylcysteine decarboxylase, partial [Verrucomicrobiota bacterium]
DDVRRLTNFSTGKLGSQLANLLTARGHTVTLLLGYYAVYRGEQKAREIQTFTTTADLSDRLQKVAGQPPAEAVFHAAAVSDFTFGKVWERLPSGNLAELRAGKISTRQGTLLAELIPTTKIIGKLRQWFPNARLVGWKYEVDGDRDQLLAKAEQQIAENKTDACVANGRAYGAGFGLVTVPGRSVHLLHQEALFEALEKLVGA